MSLTNATKTSYRITHSSDVFHEGFFVTRFCTGGNFYVLSMYPGHRAGIMYPGELTYGSLQDAV